MTLTRARVRAALLVIVAALVVAAGVERHRRLGVAEARLREALWQEAGLPLDLLDFSDRLTELRLPAGLADLGWLGDRLRHLEVSGLDARASVDLPRRLSSFGAAGYVEPEHVAALPVAVTEVFVRQARWSSVPPLPRGLIIAHLGAERLEPRDLPRSLRHLSLNGSAVPDLWGLPDIDTLELAGQGIQGLDGIPTSVRTLILRDTAVQTLRQLPKFLAVLHLDRNHHLDPIDPARLPAFLVDLTLQRQLIATAPAGAGALRDIQGAPWRRLKYLRALRLHDVSPQVRSLDLLPAHLSELELEVEAIRGLKKLPPNLRVATFRGERALDLSGLPPTLRVLRLEGAAASHLATLAVPIDELEIRRFADPGFDDLRSVPESVVRLVLKGTRVKSFSHLPPRLRELTVLGSDLETLPTLPRGLTSLDLSGSTKLRSLAGIERLTSLEELRIAGTRVDSTVGLPASLRVLDIAGTKISRLEALPDLVEIRFGQRQLRSLAGLPTTVLRLRVEDQTEQQSSQEG